MLKTKFQYKLNKSLNSEVTDLKFKKNANKKNANKKIDNPKNKITNFK